MTGAEIQALRKRLNLTQRRLADYLNLKTTQAISRMEHGRVQPDGPIRRLLELLDESDGLVLSADRAKWAIWKKSVKST